MPIHLERTLIAMLDAEDENRTAAAIARAPRTTDPPALEVIDGGATATLTAPARAPTIPTEREDRSWMAEGACAGMEPDLWFSDERDTRSRRSTTEQAKAVCMQCPVRAACLDYSLANREEHGIWGGVGPRERSRILRARKPLRPKPLPVPVRSERLDRIAADSAHALDRRRNP